VSFSENLRRAEDFLGGGVFVCLVLGRWTRIRLGAEDCAINRRRCEVILTNAFRTQATMSELADRLARGEPAAFAELYDACADRLYGWLVVHLRSAADAEDVVQETFVRLAGARKKLRRVENLNAYVFSIARNEAARLRKQTSRQQDLARPMSETAHDAALALEQVELVERALSRLNDEQREMVELKMYGNLTLREIAEVTGLPAGTVATRYRVALVKLKETLARDGCRE